MKTIYQNKTGRVALIKRGNVYTVEIAGAEYGPFLWREACEWYARHRETESLDTWNIELTDTFGGDVNYSWAKRATFTTRAGATQRAIVREGKRALGLVDRWHTDYDGSGYTLRARGACLIAFISEAHA